MAGEPSHSRRRGLGDSSVVDHTELTKIAVLLRNQVDQTRTLLAELQQTRKRREDYAAKVRVLQGAHRLDAEDDGATDRFQFTPPKRSNIVPFRQTMSRTVTALEQAQNIEQRVPGLIDRFKEVRDVDERGMQKAQQFNAELAWVQLPMTTKSMMAFTNRWPHGFWERMGYIFLMIISLIVFIIAVVVSGWMSIYFIWPGLQRLYGLFLRLWAYIRPWLRRIGILTLKSALPIDLFD
ncbi:hypothetical protein BKA62DRAFT_687880 [Auriculariales sp. MPI-PUGE-AT-0066]|nr:hypothetical protein BKA62DRAFT_687880 [Auriculariales sp. MPI-PUGE-AT-0066]